MRHGHLLGMGGYTLVSGPEEKGKRRQLRTLTVEDFKESGANFEFPDITEADIQDRSKGDVLFKIITILQTTWFIIQCIARGQQHLALTELELVTLALASLNWATFAFWWYKPLGVQEPVRVYVKRKVEDPRKVSIVDAL